MSSIQRAVRGRRVWFEDDPADFVPSAIRAYLVQAHRP